MAERYPGGVISKTPPTVTPPAPVGGGQPIPEGGSASGMWTLDTVLEYEKAGAWPKPLLPRELYAWGRNSSGQLGDGTVVNKSSPVQIGALTDWYQVAAGQDHTTSVKTDGTLWAWGRNNHGQLGDNTVVNKSSPVQIGALTNWSQVAASGYHTASVKTDGTLWTWGRNQYGQLGQNVATTVARSSPVQVGALTNWTQVSASGLHMASIKTDGTLWAWGFNSNGELGDGTVVARSSPVQVGALTNWSQVSAGGSTSSNAHTASIKTNGTLWAWGSNGSGRLGDNTLINKSSPIQIGALTNWAQVSAGNDGTASVKTDGTLWTWGRNVNGQLGQNIATTTDRSSPVQVGALTNWSQVSAGVLNTAAIKTDSTLWSWGRNTSGQLGDGTVVNRSSPVQIGALTNWSQISTSDHTAAITKG